jgi:carboxypeptidase Q
MRTVLLCLLLAVPGSAAVAQGAPTAEQRDAVERLTGRALVSDRALDLARRLCDDIGARPSNSAAMRKAVEWSQDRMREGGLVNVRAEPVSVPNWIRGPESLTVLAPVERKLTMLGLGPSVATPPGGLVAEVVAVRSFDELERLGRAGVEGKIVLFDPPWVNYGTTGTYRTRGASRAAALGAVGSLVRSITPRSLDTPHTGAVLYAKDQPKIPAAAVTVEGAAYLRRLLEAGQTVRVRLDMQHRTLEDAPSANVVGEVRGRERPEEIVVISAHLDSWDVGQGALDDATGCAAAIEAARLIAELPVPPQRTVRVVLFTDEEMGGSGADAYREAHRSELPNHVAAFELDTGTEPHTGYGVDVRAIGGTPDSLRTKAEADSLRRQVLAGLTEFDWALAPLGAARHAPGGAGINLGPPTALGMLGGWLNQETRDYFDHHHAPSDTFDKIVPEDFRRNVAVAAVLAYLLADREERLLPWPEAEVGGTR